MAEWFEDFFDGLYSEVMLGLFDGRRTLGQARIVKRLLGARKGQTVLDVPCGWGRLTIPLARMGLRMTGVDLNRTYLHWARLLARKEAVSVRFVQGDMRGIGFEGEFDAAFNWFGSFGYFSDRDNRSFVQRVFRALKPGGRFLVEGPNKSCILASFAPRIEETIAGIHILHQNRWDARTNRVCTLWTMVKGRKMERHRTRMRIFSGPEMRSLLRSAGFRDIRLYGGWEPVGRLTRHSHRLIAVGTKPRG